MGWGSVAMEAKLLRVRQRGFNSTPCNLCVLESILPRYLLVMGRAGRAHTNDSKEGQLP